MPIIMQNLIIQTHKRLLKSAKTVSTAESCTAGILSSLLTQLSGSSKYFILGVTTYSDQAKKHILKVPASLLRAKGAVSRETALLMARNVRKLARSDFGLSITGIAGPNGGTPRKPVGTVFIALTAENTNICKKFLFHGNRDSVRRQATLKALKLLNENLHRH